MTRTIQGRPERRVRQWVPSLVLAVTLLATIAASQYVRSTASAKDRLRFQTAVLDAESAVDRRLETYIELLRATAALFVASDEVTDGEFRAFVERLELGERYPGIQAVGFSIQVSGTEADALVARMRSRGVTDFRIWPDEPGSRRHAIVYVEPLDRRNRVVVGYDMFTEPVRRTAMERARDTGLPAATGRVALVQQIDDRKQAGFLVCVPVYRSNRPITTVDDRRRALHGFVYGAFRADDLLTGVMDLGHRDLVDLQVFDGERSTTDTLMHDSERLRSRVVPHAHRLTATRMLKVAGRSWLLAFTTGPSFEESSEHAMAPVVFGVGLVLSLVLFAVTRSEVRARARAEGVAANLREAEQERERLLARETEARGEAQAANRAKDLFLAALSHELRTPLNAILGWATMLRSGRLDEVQRQQALEVIERNANAQAGLIQDLLDVSRVITGKLRVDLRPMDLGSAVEAALDSVRPAAEAKGVAIEWSERESAPVVGDADRLQQIVWNLLSNAIKFTPGRGRVDLRLRRVGANVELVVEDTGIGIDSGFLPRVFERFSQVESPAARPHAGLGLGLAIVRHLTELQGGTVRAESAGEGKGSIFVVSFPARASSAGGADGVGDAP